MGLVTKTNTFSSGQIVQASDHNTNFDTLYTLVNGNIDNANVKSSAGIDESKLTFSASGHDHSGTTNGKNVAISSFTISGQTKGDILYFDGTVWARLGSGAAGTTLTMAAGLPSWA
jgi:hypothetical protein